ncbi:hypothetical protein GCM10009654_44790 [Streptomyces hebeiensis]|uniref:Uncharacterized protein n=1 Tax=Streptomyces hebeiensis TaxID=229486 RepID=A0ABN1UYU0_9ACTN
MDALVVANEVGPYVTAAVAAYGTAVVTRTTDSAADATVSLGRRIVQRLWRREESRDDIGTAIRDLADAPDDADFQALLRAHIKRALLDDPALTADLARLLPASGVAVTASGDGAVAVQNNSGVISTGSGATVQR